MSMFYLGVISAHTIITLGSSCLILVGDGGEFGGQCIFVDFGQCFFSESEGGGVMPHWQTLLINIIKRLFSLKKEEEFGWSSKGG